MLGAWQPTQEKCAKAQGPTPASMDVPGQHLAAARTTPSNYELPMPRQAECMGSTTPLQVSARTAGQKNPGHPHRNERGEEGGSEFLRGQPGPKRKRKSHPPGACIVTSDTSVG